MNPRVHLTYMTLLGYDQATGSYARRLHDTYSGIRHKDRISADAIYNSTYAGIGQMFMSLVNSLIVSKYTTARAKYIYQEEQNWSCITAREFLNFLERYRGDK